MAEEYEGVELVEEGEVVVGGMETVEVDESQYTTVQVIDGSESKYHLHQRHVSNGEDEGEGDLEGEMEAVDIGDNLDAEHYFQTEEEYPGQQHQMIMVQGSGSSGPQMIRVDSGQAKSGLASGAGGSPVKVQLIGSNQGMKRQQTTTVRMSSGTGNMNLKPLVQSTSSGAQGTVVVRGQASNPGGSRIGGQKVQYYRVMQTGDSKNLVQAASYRPVTSTGGTAAASLKTLAPASYSISSEPQVLCFPKGVSQVRQLEQPSLFSFKRKSILSSGLRKPCNCTKSMCLKLYCDCFANGEFCRNCNCKDCHNNLVHDSERTKSIKSCLDRNPHAFQPKIGIRSAAAGKGRSEVDRQHQKGCHCKKSSCLKNYCECYEAKVPCTNKCKCVSCRNTEADRQSKGSSAAAKLIHTSACSGLLSLASAAATADLRPDSPMTDTSSNEKPDPKKMPWFYMTDEVVECTTLCMVAQAEELENRGGIPEEEIERAILKEFGRCLQQIIENANVASV